MYKTKNLSRQLSTEHKRPCKMVHTLADEILHLDWLPPHDTNDTAITYSIAQQN